MFIRALPYKRKDGEQRNSFVLLRSQRIKGVTKQKTLLNLGQDFCIPKEDWKELVQQVVAHLKGEQILPFKEEDEDFQNTAASIAQRLLDQGFDIHAKNPKQTIKILVDDVEHEDSKTVAGERLILEAMEELGFPQLLLDLGIPELHVKLACAMIVARMLEPGSEASTYRWMTETSSILEVLGLDTPHLNTLYNCSDWIHKYREEIMDGLYGNTRDIFDFEETIVFYDLTNTFYHGKDKGELLRWGRSKQKRNDCPLVTLALTLDGSGFPRSVEILPGNAAEPETLEQAIQKLNGQTPTVIMDAGIATEDNIAYLKDNQLDWIAVARTKTPPVPTKDPDQEFTTAGNKKIRAWKLYKDESEQHVYIHSEAKQHTADQILAAKCTKFEEELTHLHEGLSKPGCLKNHEKVLRKVGRLTEKYKKVAYMYEVKVTQKKDRTKGTRKKTKKKKVQHAASVTFTKRDVLEEQSSAAGGYVLLTSHTDWDVKKVACTYWRLTEIESTFRVMKSELGLRPLYHSRDDRIEGHMMITVLAYHFSHMVRTKLKKESLHHSWSTVRKELNKVKRITTILPMNPSRGFRVKVDQKLTPFTEQIFHAMGYTYNPDATREKQEYIRPKKPPPNPTDS